VIFSYVHLYLRTAQLSGSSPPHASFPRPPSSIAVESERRAGTTIRLIGDDNPLPFGTYGCGLNLLQHCWSSYRVKLELDLDLQAIDRSVWVLLVTASVMRRTTAVRCAKIDWLLSCSYRAAPRRYTLPIGSGHILMCHQESLGVRCQTVCGLTPELGRLTTVCLVIKTRSQARFPT